MIKKTIKDSGSFVYLLKGLRFIGQHKSLLKYSIIQVMITCINFMISLYFVVTKGKFLFDDTIGCAPWLDSEWYMITLYYVLIVPFFLALMIITFYVALLVSQIIIGPFNSQLVLKK